MQDDATTHGPTMATLALNVAPAARILMYDASEKVGTIEDDHALAAINRILSDKAAFNIRAVSMSFGVKEYWTSDCSSRNIFPATPTITRSCDFRSPVGPRYAPALSRVSSHCKTFSGLSA